MVRNGPEGFNVLGGAGGTGGEEKIAMAQDE